jgi:chromosome segregation ATPase
MISDLQAKVIKEGEETQATYEEFEKWCEERSGEIQREITTSKGEIMNLKASIEKESATIQTTTASIEEVAGEIATAEADLAAATKIRDTENADFKTFEADVTDTIDTIERAIGVIEKGLTGGASMMQFHAGGVVKALASMVAAEAISSSDGKKLTALLQSDSDDDDTGAPAATVFENSEGSGNILDSLNGLLDKANSELEGARATEKSSLQSFEMLSMSLNDQIKFANKELEEAKKNKAEAEEAKGTAEGDLGVTTADLNDDVKTLASLHHDCMSKASEFETEVNSRSEELKALAEAKKIVIEATSLSQTSESFLQLTTRTDLVDFEAVRFVRDAAKKQHSTALAQLASRMDTTVRFGGANKADVFGKIKVMVNDMIAKLEAEAEADATEKAFCDKEVPEAQAKVDDKADEIEKITAKIDKMTAKATTLKN